MGGNVRHADKGPDRSVTTCSDCNEDFTHGKFSHFTYCPDCREKRQDNADIDTNVQIMKDSGTVKVVVKITNNSDVDVKIPIQETNGQYYEYAGLYGILGYIRLESDNWSAENVIITNSRYDKYGVRSNNTRSVEFIIEDDDVIQQDKPSTKSINPLGETFRNDVKITRGKIDNSDTISVLFEPVQEADEHLKRTADSISL